MHRDAADRVAAALEEQRREYESEFDHKNSALMWLLDNLAASDLLEIGSELLAADDPSRRILGTRLVREQAVAADDEMRQGALAAVTEVLSEEVDEEVLLWLVAAVSFIGDSSALPAVEHLSTHVKATIRDQAASAISACAGPDLPESAKSALLALAGDADREVRYSALFELGVWWELGAEDPRIEQQLRAALTDDDSRLQQIASRALHHHLM